MFPLRDENPTARPAIATILIVGLNVAVWFLVQGMGREPALVESICRLGLIPGELLGRIPVGSAVALGPNYSCVVDGSGSHWTALSSMFMHGGWMHLLGNMWFLWIFGDNVEDVMGRGRFVVFYLLCGFGADAAQMLSNPDSAIPMVGASGAIGGVMGAYAVQFPKARVQTLLILGFFARMINVPAWGMLGYWFGFQLLMGLPTVGKEEGGVAFWAHVGGFVAGVALVLLFRNPKLVAAHQAAVSKRRAMPRVGWP
ncbi:MAG: rhomboid family intramembrane serine protease [Acidobacteriota bacterium]|nr:rhomboid family intramembrane serine protease [Acidobacteriota bacterium]